MSPKLILAAGALSLAAFLVPAVSAASPAGVPDGQTEAVAQARPHNHMREKIGVPASAPETKQAKAEHAKAENAKAKKPLHDHRTFHKQM